MDLFELKREQLKLAPKVVLRDGFSTCKTIAGIDCVTIGHKILAGVVVCDASSFALLEKKTYLLNNPLPYQPGFEAYREMPAMIEAYNQLEQEPDIIIVRGAGIAHPRKLGIATHLGLALNKPTIGVAENLLAGRVEKGKIILDNEVVGFEIKTREHANPLYISPGHLMALGTVLNLIPKMIRYPHKMPEPLHLAHKMARQKVQEEQKLWVRHKSAGGL
ncbi:endonuclease V [Candidatus Woesearchaeota archaeon]|nr:endonuclease V [Candidatus Woesearchaeota archaeon]